MGGNKPRSPLIPPQPLAQFKVGVDNVIFSVDTDQNRLLVLLVMRDAEPFRDRWCLPGTLVRQGESLESAAYRILAEKIRVQNLYLEQLFTFDPSSTEDLRYLSVSYFALAHLAKLQYSPVAFDVLPELFTLGDLYQLYTTVLGENFSDYSNFRSRLLKLGFLQETGDKTSRGAGRPASLYRFDAQAFAPFKDKPMIFI
jgi:ADP-ribose pyrophosphatase YjhB (NUDIX family)